jgi:cyclophilin family peptidyl-prolyl cis-trans isomerase
MLAPAIAGSQLLLPTVPAFASTSDSSLDEVTDRIFLLVKGLPGAAASADTKRIVIGLFGKEEPSAVAQLKKLFSSGLPAPCRPLAERTLQKEQLEANKVYNGCKESEEIGVTLRYSTIWRIIKDERIDVGAVSGRFIARSYHDWVEETSLSGQRRKHDELGVVSVRRGSDGGFGFTIYPGDGMSNVDQLNQDQFVVGKVIEGIDIVCELNEVPVVRSANVNYMALTGGPTTTTSPNRSCRYGGPMYCNENKPLVKLTITEIGIL